MWAFERRWADGCKVFLTDRNRTQAGSGLPGEPPADRLGLPEWFGPFPAPFALEPDGFGSDRAGLGVHPVEGMISSYSSVRFAVPIQPPGQVARERPAGE